MSKESARNLEKILSEIESSSLEDLSYEELMSLRKEMNMYGRTIEGSDNYLTFSFTNLKEKYIENLTTTAMIGYLNRAVDEWNVPDGLPVIRVQDYNNDPSVMCSYYKNWTLTDKIKKQIADNMEAMKKRVIVKEFLQEVFNYNPDVHTRSAYKPNAKDISRGIVDTPAANIAIEQLKKKDSKFREEMLEYDRLQKVIAMKENLDIPDAHNLKAAAKVILPSVHYMNADYDNMSPEDLNLLRTVCESIPPADTFYKYRRYLEANYEKLREAVEYLYCVKPEFDIAINPYSWHKNEEEAIEFQKKHKNEVIADIIKAHSGKWNFFAPFEKVRSTTKYYNDNTIVLEEIANQIERDGKLGEELMKNKIKAKKQVNIKEDGPDAELFTKWKTQNTTLKDMNAITNKNDYNDDDCPDDGIQCDVYKTDSDGNMVKDKFYSKASAPAEVEHTKP
jgi:hypothetical protein